MLTIAHELGKDVVAVGVDSDEDLAYVQAIGCDYGQGFFFSELMTEREVVHLLNSIARSVRRDDKEQEKEAKRAERRAAKEREREEKEKERALALAEADAKESARRRQPPERAGAMAAANRRPRWAWKASRGLKRPAQAAERPRSNVPVPEPARLLPGDVPAPLSARSQAARCFRSAAERNRNGVPLSMKRAVGGNCTRAGITLDRRALRELCSHIARPVRLAVRTRPSHG